MLKKLKLPLLLIFTILLTLGLSLSLDYLLAAWSNPTGIPTACPSGSPGCDAPINTAANLQVKDGTLWIGGDNYTLNPGQFGLLVEKGNVGIGTTGPQFPLHIESSVIGDGRFVARFFVPSLSGNKFADIGIGRTDVVGGAGFIRFRNNNGAGMLNMFIQGDPDGQALTIAQGGNVGIGTTIPGAKLDVNGNVSVWPVSCAWCEGLTFYMPSATAWGGIRWQRQRTGYDGNWAVGYTALDSTDDLVFIANNGGTQVNNILRLTKAGNVGIGTTAPTNLLEVYKSGTAAVMLSVRNSDGGLNGRVGLAQENSAGGSLYVGTLPYAGVVGIDSARPFQIVAGNSAAVTILSGGNVGIGTTDPGSSRVKIVAAQSNSILNIRASSATPSDLIGITFSEAVWDKARIVAINKNAGNAEGDLAFYTGGWPTSINISEAMRITQTGNVGIGTPNPGAKLQINPPVSTEGLRIVASDYSPLNIRNNTTDIFRIDQSGILQVGQVPWARLTSFPSACASGQYVSAVGGTLTCSTPPAGTGTVTSITAGSGLSGGTITTSGTISLNLANANTWTGAQTFGANTNFPGSGVWNSSGNVGIGITDPGAKLELSKGNNLLGVLRITQRVSGAAAYGLDMGLDPATGDPVFSRIVNDVVSEAFRIQRSTGNVGIGTTGPPGEKLEVNGNIKATAFLYSSDYNLKQNIQPLSGKTEMEKILKLSGVSFDWKESGKHDIGLIAQEVEKVFPEFVKTDENSELKSIDYAKLIVPLIESVKEQQKEIDELKAICK